MSLPKIKHFPPAQHRRVADVGPRHDDSVKANESPEYYLAGQGWLVAVLSPQRMNALTFGTPLGAEIMARLKSAYNVETAKRGPLSIKVVVNANL